LFSNEVEILQAERPS